MANDEKISRAEALKRMGGLVLSSALAPLLSAQEEPSRPSSSKPNILWITGEGIPLKVIGCYGSQLMSTPNIDRIANEGMRFANSFCTNALCAPSRATLLTGTYNNINGMISNPYGVPQWRRATCP